MLVSRSVQRLWKSPMKCSIPVIFTRPEPRQIICLRRGRWSWSVRSRQYLTSCQKVMVCVVNFLNKKYIPTPKKRRPSNTRPWDPDHQRAGGSGESETWVVWARQLHWRWQVLLAIVDLSLSSCVGLGVFDGICDIPKISLKLQLHKLTAHGHRVKNRFQGKFHNLPFDFLPNILLWNFVKRVIVFWGSKCQKPLRGFGFVGPPDVVLDQNLDVFRSRLTFCLFIDSLNSSFVQFCGWMVTGYFC